MKVYKLKASLFNHISRIKSLSLQLHYVSELLHIQFSLQLSHSLINPLQTCVLSSIHTIIESYKKKNEEIKVESEGKKRSSVPIIVREPPRRSFNFVSLILSFILSIWIPSFAQFCIQEPLIWRMGLVKLKDEFESIRILVMSLKHEFNFCSCFWMNFKHERERGLKMMRWNVQCSG